AAPYSSQASVTALNFARALLDQDHEIYRLFFYGDGVHNADKSTVVAVGETNLQNLWDELIRANELDSVVCVSSALKRGVLDPSEAERHQTGIANLRDSTDLAGLGQFVDAALQSDRVISFG
ncbi:MAG: sulfurtransferase complex subunit TusD, partial [Gimesia chilikensis]